MNLWVLVPHKEIIVSPKPFLLLHAIFVELFGWVDLPLHPNLHVRIVLREGHVRDVELGERVVWHW